MMTFLKLLRTFGLRFY